MPLPLILAMHIPDVENVRILGIYQRYKLSDNKYALTDVTSYYTQTYIQVYIGL